MSNRKPALSVAQLKQELARIQTELTAVRLESQQQGDFLDRLRRFAEAGPVGIIRWKTDGSIVYANERFLKMVGHEREDLTSGRLNWRDMTPDEFYQRDMQALAELKATGEIVPYLKAYQRKDGSRVPILLSAVTIDDAREREGMAFVLDLTEYENAKEHIQSIARFPEENPNPVMRVDQNGVLLYANPPAKALVAAWQTGPGPSLPLNFDTAAFIGAGKPAESQICVAGRFYLLTFSPNQERGDINIYGCEITDRVWAEEKLRESETKYRTMIETANEGICVVDADRRTTYVNDRMAEMLGCSPQEMMLAPWSDFLNEEGKKYSDGNLEKRRKGNRDSYELKLIRKDGLPLWSVVNTTPVFDSDGRFSGSMSMLTDITRRKQAERTLQRNNALLHGVNRILECALRAGTDEGFGEACLQVAQTLTDSKIGFIAEIGPDGLLHDIAISDPGWKACAMYDQTGHRRLPPSGFSIHGLFGRVVRDGKALFSNAPDSHPDSIGVPEGHPKLTAFLGVPLIRKARAVGIIAVANRETAYSQEDADDLETIAPVLVEALVRRRAERALRESECRLERAQEIAHLGSWELDLIHNALTWSDEIYRIFGLEPRAFGATYEAFLDRVHPDDRNAVDEAYSGSVRGGRPEYEIEHRVIRKNTGEIRWVREKCQNIRDHKGQIVRSVGMVLDITDRRRDEEALRKANEELEQRVRERTTQLDARVSQLRALARELTLTEQRERRKMANLLHDHLQQLLVSAKFRVATLVRGGDDLRQDTREIEELLDESIEASRSLTAELSPPILHEAGLNAGLEWLTRWMSKKHGFTVELEKAEPVPLADDVKILLFHSIRELLFNAVKHSNALSARIDLKCQDGYLQLVVSDQGIGFDPERIPCIDGLGLSSIRERLGFVGGRIEIDSAPGKGSRFVLTVPVRETMADDKAQFNGAELPSKDRQVAVVPPIQGAKIRVLLADDHAVMRQGLAQLLGNERDIEVVGGATDGQEAVEMASELVPDVILMDMSMPRLNGVEATRIIHNNFPKIRIIGLSMFEGPENELPMREAGVVDYLTKSGPAEILVAAIRRHAVGSRQSKPLI